MSETLKVAIQGVRASFHDAAARKFFPGRQLSLVECPSFQTLCQALTSESDRAVMAIENSIAGCIVPNYRLLEEFDLRIIGETYLRIEMALMALPGQTLDDIRSAHSHPMALLQCDEFLTAHPAMRRIEATDTAESAQLIAAQKLAGAAAIASRLAAETYGLEILAAGIETNQQNYTRFLVLRKETGSAQAIDAAASKASIRFEITHHPGSLARVLDIFSEHSVNMMKIQCVPILGRPYQYAFHMDVEWEKRSNYEQAMTEIAPEVIRLIRFGEYPRGDWKSL
jgi:prephenate dehydratase